LKRLCCSSEDMFFCAHERLAATQTSCEQFLGGGQELREEGEADEPGLLSPSLCHAVHTDREWKISDQWPKEDEENHDAKTAKKTGELSKALVAIAAGMVCTLPNTFVFVEGGS
jgi:hypothetical protein